MKRKYLVGAVSAILSSGALAQSAFEGFYGQVSIGYENNSVHSARLTGQETGGLPSVSISASPSSNATPLILGLGYTFLIRDKFLLGLGLDYSPLTQTTQAAGFYYPEFGADSEYDYYFSVSNRLSVFVKPGYAIDKDKLAYVKLGYSNQQIRYTQTNCCSTPSNKANVSGYVLGLGYKQIISNGFYGFVEANFYAYDNASLSSTYTNGLGGTVSSNPRSSAFNFLVGVGYKF